MRPLNHGKPTHLDLFSGIGGFSLAFESAGFRTIGFSEIDPYASAVLKKHWPDVPNYGDVRNVPKRKYNVLTAGFPCQDVSKAGRRGGLSGSRTGLWFPTLQIIKRDRPDFVQLENVPNLRTCGADEILLGLEEAGYTAGAFVVGAWGFGSVQARERVWITAFTTKQRNKGLGASWAAGESRPGRQSCQKDLQGQDWRTRPLLKSGTKSLLCRADDGIPNWVDRIGCLGNSICPQVALPFAKAIYREITQQQLLKPS